MLTQVLPQHFPQHSFPYGAIFRGGIAPLTADRIVMQLTEEFLSIIGATSLQRSFGFRTTRNNTFESNAALKRKLPSMEFLARFSSYGM